IQCSVADTYTLHADSDSFGQITSGNIAIADASAATDFFRSVITGAWNAAATWESSHDGVTNWMAATLAPTSSANMITIRAGHTVTINTTVIVDEVMIAGGGVLLVNSTSGTLNLADGPGDDLVVSNGG